MNKRLLLLGTAVLFTFLNTKAQTYLSTSDSLFDFRFGAGFSDHKDGINASGPRKVIDYGDFTIVGGLFDNAFGTIADNIAMYDKKTQRWYALGKGLNGAVNDITIYKNELVVVGEFSKAGDVPANRIAKYNLQTKTWSRVTGYTFPGGLLKTAVYHDTLIASSNYSNNAGFYTYYLADTTWRLFLTTAQPVLKIKSRYDKLYVTGSFSSSTGLEHASNTVKTIPNGSMVLSYSNGTWTSMGAQAAGVPSNSKITAVEADEQGNVYIGGDYSTFNGSAFGGVLKYNGSSWSAITGLEQFSAANSIIIYDLALDKGKLYAGGSFIPINTTGTPTEPSNVMVYENNTWKVAGRNLGLIASGAVTTLSVSNGMLSVVGTFTNPSTLYSTYYTNGMILVNTTTNKGINPSGGIQYENKITSIETSGDNVYFFGSFTRAGNFLADRFAKLNLITGVWDSTFYLKASLGNTPTFMKEVNGKIYVGAKKTGTTRYAVFGWDEATKTFSQVGGIDFASALGGVSMQAGKLITTNGSSLFTLENGTWTYKAGVSMALSGLYVYNPVVDAVFYTGFNNGGYLGVFKYDGTTTLEQVAGFGNGASIKALHADKNGMVYIGGKFPEGIPGTKNLFKYNPITKTTLAMGGGVDVGTYGTYVSSITSVGDTIFAAGEITRTYDSPNGAMGNNSNVVVWLPEGKWISFAKNIYYSSNNAAKIIKGFKKGLVGNLGQYFPVDNLTPHNTYAASTEGFWDWNIVPSPAFPVVTPLPLSVSHSQLSHSSASPALTLAPNPTRTTLHITPTTMSAQPANWVVYDLLGNSLKKGSFEGNTTATLPVEELESGLYVVGVTMSNGTSHTAKFLKQ